MRKDANRHKPTPATHAQQPASEARAALAERQAHAAKQNLKAAQTAFKQAEKAAKQARKDLLAILDKAAQPSSRKPATRKPASKPAQKARAMHRRTRRSAELRKPTLPDWQAACSLEAPDIPAKCFRRKPALITPHAARRGNGIDCRAQHEHNLYRRN